MTRQKIKFIFNRIKQEATLDFALTKGYCCKTCTWAEIENDYGQDSKGIWLKWYDKGGNKTKWDNNGTYYIGHNLTETQKDIIYNILQEYFEIEWDKSNDNSIKIKDKGE